MNELTTDSALSVLKDCVEQCGNADTDLEAIEVVAQQLAAARGEIERLLTLLDVHRNWHDTVACPGLPECTVCSVDNGQALSAAPSPSPEQPLVTELIAELQNMLSDYEDLNGVGYCDCDDSVGLTCNACAARSVLRKAGIKFDTDDIEDGEGIERPSPEQPVAAPSEDSNYKQLLSYARTCTDIILQRTEPVDLKDFELWDKVLPDAPAESEGGEAINEINARHRIDS